MPASLIEADDEGRPRPLHTVVVEWESPGGDAGAVTRLWYDADAKACGLCRACIASPLTEPVKALGRDGKPSRLVECTHTFRGKFPDDPDAGSMFSPDGLR